MSEQAGSTLLMIGDSLIEWGDWDVLLPELKIINRGIAGEHTEELSVRLIHEIDDIREPDHILLMGSPYFPEILASMLPRLAGFRPKSVITLNSIMPMRIQGLAEETVTAINQELRDVAERSGCRFLDMTKAFTEKCLPITKPCFMNDGVHLLHPRLSGMGRGDQTAS